MMSRLANCFGRSSVVPYDQPLPNRTICSGVMMAEEGSVELALAGAWCQVLGVTSVQPEDNFFDLGGDSLTAVEFVVAVEDTLGASVPLEVLILDGTFRGVVEALDPGATR
jgi:acyl carrier protein